MSSYTHYKTVRAQVDQCCEALDKDPASVLLLAVSKQANLEAIEAAYASGCRDFGENRPDVLLEKYALHPDYRWHFIGNIQSRRIPDIVKASYLIHSVCKQEHFAKIDAAARKQHKVQRILLEVNVSGEASKSGFDQELLKEVYKEALKYDHICVCGLMTMAPQGDPAAIKACFSGLARLQDELKTQFANHPASALLTELSMGMSEDWPCALEEGATIVRIGRAIFSEDFLS